jgi:hypothetical protein
VLHIHRIRVDVPVGDRLRWDLLWLGLFAVLPFLAAFLMARQRASGGSGSGPRRAVALAVLVTASAGLSLRAPPDVSARPVLFRAGMDQADILAAAASVDATVIAVTGDRLAVLDMPEGGAWRLYARGALVVGGPGSPAACLSWANI